MISFVLFIISYTFDAAAFEMSNDQYRIRGGNFNTFGGRATGQSRTITFTSGEIAPGLYKGENYTLRAGFQYLRVPTSFKFSISNTSINFGQLTPGEPITRTNTLTVTTGSAPGFQIAGSQNNELKAASSQVIPDTTCDSGACTETSADLWESPLAYGFGYRCDNKVGKSCDNDFLTADFYKQFANTEKKEEEQIIMFSNSRGTKTGEISYKVNIAPTQPAGIYQNIILYIATPSI